MKMIGLGVIVALIGSTVPTELRTAYGQIDGALQYPPPSVGQDAQPPPPARMAPQTVSPRRIELGVSGSSQPPADYQNRVQSFTDIDRPTRPTAPPLGASPTPPLSAGRN
jgi:hypothetical protein